jgi:hypothetical protein
MRLKREPEYIYLYGSERFPARKPAPSPSRAVAITAALALAILGVALIAAGWR